MGLILSSEIEGWSDRNIYFIEDIWGVLRTINQFGSLFYMIERLYFPPKSAKQLWLLHLAPHYLSFTQMSDDIPLVNSVNCARIEVWVCRFVTGQGKGLPKHNNAVDVSHLRRKTELNLLWLRFRIWIRKCVAMTLKCKLEIPILRTKSILIYEHYDYCGAQINEYKYTNIAVVEAKYVIYILRMKYTYMYL